MASNTFLVVVFAIFAAGAQAKSTCLAIVEKEYETKDVVNEKWTLLASIEPNCKDATLTFESGPSKSIFEIFKDCPKRHIVASFVNPSISTTPVKSDWDFLEHNGIIIVSNRDTKLISAIRLFKVKNGPDGLFCYYVCDPKKGFVALQCYGSGKTNYETIVKELGDVDLEGGTLNECKKK